MPDTHIDKRERWQLPAMVVAVIAIVVLPFVFLSSVLKEGVEAAREVEQTGRVEATLHALAYDIRDNEAAVLALVAGFDTPLIQTRLADSGRRIPEGVESLAELTRGHADQQLRVGELKGLLARRAAFIDEVASSDGALPVAAGEIVVRYPVRPLVDSILAEESRLLRVRLAHADRLRRQALG